MEHECNYKEREHERKVEVNVCKAAIVFSGVAACWAIYCGVKTKRLYNMMNMSINDMSKNVRVDVSQEIINRAVERAVSLEVDNNVRKVSNEIVRQFRGDLKTEVVKCIDASSASVRESVAKEIRTQVAVIDIADLRKEIISEAKDKIATKFDSDLDSLLSEFNQNLSNVGKIYNSIAENMTRKNDSVFKV